MRSLYVIGGGGFATEVLFVIERMNIVKKEWINIYVIDDNIEIGTKVREYEIVGDIDYLSSINDDIDIVLTINDTSIRKQIIDKISRNKKNVFFPNIISSTSIIDEKYLQIGKGNIIMHFVILSTNLIVGDFNIFNSYTGVGHDSIIGSFNTFNPRVAISGKVLMNDLNNFGVNSSVLQNKKIGSDNQIWMNSTIVKNIKDGGKYFGVPAKKISL